MSDKEKKEQSPICEGAAGGDKNEPSDESVKKKSGKKKNKGKQADSAAAAAASALAPSSENDNRKKELLVAKEKLEALQRIKEEKLLQMRAIKLELEQKKELMKRETQSMREVVQEQMSASLVGKIDRDIEEQQAAKSKQAKSAAEATGNDLITISEEDVEETEECEAPPSVNAEAQQSEEASSQCDHSLSLASTSHANEAACEEPLSEEEAQRKKLQEQLVLQMQSKFQQEQSVRNKEAEAHTRLQQQVVNDKEETKKELQLKLKAELDKITKVNNERTEVICTKMAELEQRKTARDAMTGDMALRTQDLQQQLTDMNTRYKQMQEKAAFRDKKIEVSKVVAEQLQARLEDAQRRTREQEELKAKQMKMLEEAKKSLEEQQLLTELARKEAKDRKGPKNGDTEGS